MSGQTVIFFLVCMVMLQAGVIIYQRAAFQKGMQTKLKQISDRLSQIIEQDTDGQVMVFTDQQVLKELIAQINMLLLSRQKVRVDYRRQEASSRKMLSNISHDMKTPLTVILGYLEILRMRDKEDVALQKAEAKAKQVLEMMQEFFTLAKLEAGDQKLELTEIPVNELCRENVLCFYELLQQKEFTVDVRIPEQNIVVFGEKDSLDRILNNLIVNALRYGSDGRYFGLELREEEAFAYIDITDQGKGIEKEFADSVFERLYTMEDSRNREIQGNGLGLTIARNLARQMGGDILLKSEPDVRTVFTVKLKKCK